MQIVLARLDDDVELAERGQTDIGRPHKYRNTKKPVALMWANSGTDEDFAKAQSFAKREGYTVIMYDGSETDPLGRARDDIGR